jgi:hypothetical protein
LLTLLLLGWALSCGWCRRCSSSSRWQLRDGQRFFSQQPHAFLHRQRRPALLLLLLLLLWWCCTTRFRLLCPVPPTTTPSY